MSTIFDGYNKLNDKQIINQLAILETINISNIFVYYKNQFKENTVGTIKKIIETLGKEDDEEEIEEKNNKTEEEKVNELYQLLLENKEQLKGLSRDELNLKLKLSLCDRSGASIEDSEETISLEIVNEAMKKFDLPNYLTPAQKIDEIYEIYNEKVIYFLKNNPEMANQNKPLDFGDPKLLINILIETIKSWDMIQGSKIIDREVLAESVWLSAMSKVEPFTPPIEELPSFKIEKLEDDRYQEDTVFFSAIECFEKAKQSLETNDYKLSDLGTQTDRVEKTSLNKKSELLQLKKHKKLIEKKLREIEVDLEYTKTIYNKEKRELKISELLQNHLSTEQHYKINSENIEHLNDEVKELDKMLRSLSLDREYLLEQEKNLKNRRDDARKEYMIQTDTRYQELKLIWENHYSDFELESQFLEQAIEYTIEQRLEIERVLEELYRSKDPRVMSKEFEENQTSGNYNLEMLLGKNKVINLQYSVYKNEEQEALETKLIGILESVE